MLDVSALKSTIVRSMPLPAGRVERLFPTPPGYPWELVGALALADGVTLRRRPIRPDDEPRLVELFNRLSPRTVYQRFFRAYDRLPEHWYRHFANVDYRARLALVAEEPGAGASLCAVARYEPGETPGTTEIAIVVEDGWQGRGLGTRLLDALLAVAEARGLRRFTADILADNRPMLHVLARLADVRRRELEGGVLNIEFERQRQRSDKLANLVANPIRG
jgi:RimJ/RimL family protein N-acetyltransferase